MFSGKTLKDTAEHCNICPLAKQTKLPFPRSMNKSVHFAERIHCDVWGPFKFSAYDHRRYFLTLVDDYNKYTWVCFMSSKDECIVVLKFFIAMLKNKF